MASKTAPRALALYKSLLREASKFPDYNLRNYALRRVRDAYRDNKGVDPKQLTPLLKFAEENLTMMKRQVIISELYDSHQKTVIETRP